MTRGICVCVDYADLLAITLHRNARHLEEIFVVTHPRDEATKAVVSNVVNAKLFETDAFYRHGASFNKGLAIEEGFAHMGREGWILILDADTLLPDSFWLPALNPHRLYGARRRMLEDVSKWRPGLDWRQLPISADRVIAGYFQLFHASNTFISKLPWYDVTFQHAGGCDGYFQERFPLGFQTWLAPQVLHLGPRDTNWFGRVGANGRTDKMMKQFLAQKGWKGLKGRYATPIPDHVEVPGYAPSDYALKGRM